MDETPLLALEHLRRTPGRTLAKEAVKELVRRDVLRHHPFVSGWRQTRRPGLTSGSAALPDGALLLLVARTVSATPASVQDARQVRDVRRVARRLAGLGHGLADAALHDLAAAGLVEQRPQRVLGVVERTRWRRTPAGEQALELQRRRTSDEVGAADGGAHSGGGSDSGRRDGELDGDVDRDVDSSLDSSFDSSFDSGFGGDGGSGDGGGGGD